MTDRLRSAERLRAGERDVHISAFVDSITYGAGQTGASQPKWRNSWPGRLSRILNGRLGLPAGTGIVVPWNTLDIRPDDDPRLRREGDVRQLAGPGPSDLPRAGVVGRGTWRVEAKGSVVFAPIAPSTEFTIYVHGIRPVAPRVEVDGAPVELAREPLLAGPEGVEVIAWTTRGGGQELSLRPGSAEPLDLWGLEGRTGGVRVSTFARDGIGTELLAYDPDDLSGGLPLHADAARADLAIMLLGANDRRVEAAAFVERTRTAIDRVRSVGGEVLLIHPAQFDYADPLIGYPTIDERASDLARLSEVEGIPLLHLGREWDDHAEAARRGWFADGVHPSDAGLEVIARDVARYLVG
ncbi:SGNH/GDSL hydrolase family protein [Microbacterium sp. CFH 90308]|uniref:SGNH/GDSL hydrolase family protein n=1 Tax=Microbacterium salsuginis TaxID=2722803 RepID=A0ABX1KDW1_9MICO|nr:SGNH/GDSL hydrolase family protein [Microbacterium sp. CFH 90308]NLP84173.1 SGNH/GDSL hydrolase family protein [Microbacterium sp. CFH 90308]